MRDHEPDRSPRYGSTLEDVRKLEAKEIGRRRREFEIGSKTKGNLVGEGPTGLCLSGGGIRSACFNLGILEALDRRLANPEDPEGPNRLECFDYVSSVSGGSYAAGHLATTMLDSTTPDGGARLGSVDLTSKTVPGWTWGLGVWFLGVAFQWLKTGSLLVSALAFIAFLTRMLDAPDAANFCTTMGLTSDVARGFVPFWLALWAFLFGYALNSTTRRDRRWARYWFMYFGVVLLAYVGRVWHTAVWVLDPIDVKPWAMSFREQYKFMAALIAPPIVVIAIVGIWRVIRAGLPEREGRAGAADQREEAKKTEKPREAKEAKEAKTIEKTEEDEGVKKAEEAKETEGAAAGPTLKQSLLIPILVALFCLAALVTTGDISLGDPGDQIGAAVAMQDRSRWYGKFGDAIYRAAVIALSVLSIGLFLSPNLFNNALFKSARRVQEYDAKVGAGKKGIASRRGWEVMFRVVVFLCGYGFVLLLIFVLFSTVARENVSGFYEWRSDLPSEAFHLTDLREAEPAWERIERDALWKDGPWNKLAQRFMDARAAASVPTALSRRRAAEIRLLDARPFIDRALWPFAWIWSRSPWKNEDYNLESSSEVHFDKMAEQTWDQRRLAREISKSILGDPWLYTIVPLTAVKPNPSDTPKNWDEERYKGLPSRYRERAMALAAMRFPGEPLPPIDPSLRESPFPSASDEEGKKVGPPGPAAGGAGLDATIRDNNRRALHLYFPGLLRDRRDKVVFSSIVWKEDQWTRLSIFLTAGAVWVLCCVVDVNTYALQKFYRGHVIDGWVRVAAGKPPHRWLHQTRSGYRGWDFRPGERERRAPLPIINATLEGNRSLGHEPELRKDIFSFSPLAAGSGEEKYWISGVKSNKRTEEFARRNRLDIGNIVAISGAFLSPGTIANPALSAVLHLMNVQTGYWVREPSRPDHGGAARGLVEWMKSRRRKAARRIWFHVWQSLGIDREGDDRLMLTDGAHVENLGLYVLLQRRCRLIVVSDCGQEDAGAPPERRFDALLHVLQQAALDGVEVGPFLSSDDYQRWLKTGEYPNGGSPRPGLPGPRAGGLDLVRPADAAGEAEPAPAAGSFSRKHYVFARLLYPAQPSCPNGVRGLLVYLRPTLDGDEGDSLLHGALHGQFPDDDPIDQFYTPARMNAYRLLGRHIADKLMDDPVMKDVIGAILKGGEVAPPP